jgi:hypothetical protein
LIMGYSLDSDTASKMGLISVRNVGATAAYGLRQLESFPSTGLC